MNIGRDAPIPSCPFAERQARAKLSGRIGHQAEVRVAVAAHRVQMAVDETNRKLHEATEPKQQQPASKTGDMWKRRSAQ